MPKKNKNEYQKIDDEFTLLSVTKRDGRIEKALIDTWNLDKVSAHKIMVKNNGYFQTNKAVNLTEVIMGPAPAGMVLNHKNGLRADNRECNLELVPDAVNKLMKRRKGKKNNLPDGIFLLEWTRKDGTKAVMYRVRNLNNQLKSFKTVVEAFNFRVLVLVQKGADVETAKIFLGLIPRAEYNRYWQIRSLLAA